MECIMYLNKGNYMKEHNKISVKFVKDFVKNTFIPIVFCCSTNPEESKGLYLNLFDKTFQVQHNGTIIANYVNADAAVYEYNKIKIPYLKGVQKE